MFKDNAQRLEALEKRVDALEKASGQTGKPDKNTVEIDLILPEADIDGLHFNEQKVSALFERQDDDWFYSKDILFLSARNVEDDNSRDLLTEYLNTYEFAQCIWRQLPEEIFGQVITPDKIEVSLPKENQGTKQYHGVDCWYWLADRFSSSAVSFCIVSAGGTAHNNGASAVGGCSPAFRVAERHS
jgi:hypothetical protein